MADQLDVNNAVGEVIDGVYQEVHSIDSFDEATDFELKHSPNIEIVEGANGQTVKVSIGLKGLSHPQTEEHYIEWIRLFVGENLIGVVNFSADQAPEANFEIKRDNQQVIAQALCNLHGVWESRA
ncbi:MAG: class II SORL domain-containing protein [Coriobacteriales bacterium]|jgi:superoxide reductase|nr:class II SORL domain-containing protein [Coriobacteriales bacterium]